MVYSIDKSCKNTDAYKRTYEVFPRAREGFGKLLDYLGIGDKDRLLLPGYIGWSEREGSGVFDPIKDRNITPIFYHLDENLRIDFEDLKEKINNSKAKALVFIHYFGFVDEKIGRLAQLARKKGIVVIEDAAHALFSDRVGFSCGRYGDYTLYSLHKMLPIQEGGMLIGNDGRSLPRCENGYELEYDIFEYDFNAIARARIENYSKIFEELYNYGDKNIAVLRPILENGIVPQTFPVLLMNTNRDMVYFKMNDMGWGLVSLYHTMIKQLQTREFEVEGRLARQIINLPVHQDVSQELICKMVSDFVDTVHAYPL